MIEQLPSLREFQPKFYSGGATRFYLPLLYDLVAMAKPKRVVVLGFGDGQAFFTLCQAASERNVDCQCIAVRRDRPGEPEEDDHAWREGRGYGEEFFGERVRFFAAPGSALAEVADGGIDILFLDDSDSGREIREDLSAWEAKLSPQSVILVHGVGLRREDGPRTAWENWAADRPHAIFPDGIGLGVALRSKPIPNSFLLKELFSGGAKTGELTQVYALATARIDAFAHAQEAEKRVAAFETRQVWLDSLLTDRRKVQEIMDHQARAISSLEQRVQLLLGAQEEQRGHFENLRRDRAKAQLIMDTQHEQLKRLVAQTDTFRTRIETLKAQLKEHKAILTAAKKACRKKGRCFQIQPGEKVRRTFGERIARELRRLPRNLGITRNKEAPAAPPEVQDQAMAPGQRLDRYATWIAEHEPDAAGLDKQ